MLLTGSKSKQLVMETAKQPATIYLKIFFITYLLFLECYR